jgi:hypothetical protein
MRIVLELGCWGINKDGIILCNGISNEILDITKSSERNGEITEYLDTTFKLFDRPIYNNVHTALFNVQNKFSTKLNSVFTEIQFKRMEEFCIMHAKCGLFLRLKLIENEE